MDKLVDRQTFSDQLESVFTVLAEGGIEIPLTLREVKPLGTRQDGERIVDSFSLLFDGPMESQLAQSSFEFQHSELGSLIIFIVPIGPNGDAMQYEAVFN